MAYYNEKIETLPKAELEKLQYQELKVLVERLYATSVFYHDKMKAAGVLPSDIKSIADIVKLPTMKKTDLRDNYPDKLVCCPKEDLVRYHVSSGTTGKPTVVAYNRPWLPTRKMM